MPLMSGAVPQLSSSGAPLVQFDEFPVLVVDQAAEVELLADLLVAADPFLQRAGVVGDRALQHGRQVEDQRHRQQDRHNACGDADFALPAPERRRPARRRGDRRARRTAAEAPRRRRTTASARPCGRPMVPVAPATTIAASTGPAHGTYSTPSARPSPKPLLPEPNCFCGSLENGFSRSASNCGKINPRPITTSATSATQRMASCGRCSSDSSAEPAG